MDSPNLPDEFYEWLNQCPVRWFRIGYDQDSASYVFIKTEENE